MPSTNRTNSPKLYELSSRPDQPVDEEPAWDAAHMRAYRCSECSIWRLDAPQVPINAIILAEPQTILAGTGLFSVIWRPFADELLKYTGDLLIGALTISGSRTPLTNWVTGYPLKTAVIEAYRGADCRHDQCSVCGRVRSRIGWAEMSVLQRSLDGRAVYFGHHCGWPPIIDALTVPLKDWLKQFPTLRAKRVPVLDEPLDGEVLPGDPGWTGTVKQNPVMPDWRKGRHQ